MAGYQPQFFVGLPSSFGLYAGRCDKADEWLEREDADMQSASDLDDRDA